MIQAGRSTPPTIRWSCSSVTCAPAARSTSATASRSTPGSTRTRTDGRAVLGQHLGDRAGGHPAAGRDDRDRVADQLDLAEDVAGQHHGHPGLGEVAHQRAHLPDAARVEAVGRLVQDQQLRLLEQRRGDREPLLHAQRVRLHPVLRPVPQADQFQHLGHPALLHAAGVGQQRERVLGGEVAGRTAGSPRSRRPGRPPRAGAAGTSRPRIAIRPPLGLIRPSSVRSVVVLPEPFGPRKPCTCPASTTMSKPSSARRTPLRLR